MIKILGMFNTIAKIRKEILSLLRAKTIFVRSIFDKITMRIIIPINLKYFFNGQLFCQQQVD